jgi:hypothetical protein
MVWCLAHRSGDDIGDGIGHLLELS